MKKAIIIVLAVVLSAAIITGAVYIINMTENIDDYIIEKADVFVPAKKSVRHKYDAFRIDIFEYWEVSINEEERQTLDEEINDGKWVNINYDIINKFNELDYQNTFDIDFNKSDYYVCVYNYKTGENITDDIDLIPGQCSHWVALIFDANGNRYYCINESF